jgi:hypothetical protein
MSDGVTLANQHIPHGIYPPRVGGFSMGPAGELGGDCCTLQVASHFRAIETAVVGDYRQCTDFRNAHNRTDIS